MAWSWDETLYAGSAAYYLRGRMPYPPELADALRNELGLDGTGRLLDVGCGPGPLTLLLAPLFERAVGVDADADMVAEARRAAQQRDVRNAEFAHLRAEELPAGLGTFRVATFAQSFHWMQRERVAATVRAMLDPGGVWVHVNASTHRGIGAGDRGPEPPYDAIDRLVQSYVGPVRRAGSGTLPAGPPSGEEDVMLTAGFTGPTRVKGADSQVIERSEDDVVASVYSNTSSAPHLLGDRLGAFEEELRATLRKVSPNGRFSERTREIDLVLWEAEQ